MLWVYARICWDLGPSGPSSSRPGKRQQAEAWPLSAKNYCLDWPAPAEIGSFSTGWRHSFKRCFASWVTGRSVSRWPACPRSCGATLHKHAGFGAWVWSEPDEGWRVWPSAAAEWRPRVWGEVICSNKRLEPAWATNKHFPHGDMSTCRPARQQGGPDVKTDRPGHTWSLKGRIRAQKNPPGNCYHSPVAEASPTAEQVGLKGYDVTSHLGDL